MSEDHTRDGERARLPDDVSDLFSQRPGGNSGRSDADGQADAASDDDQQNTENATRAGAAAAAGAALPTPPAPLDEDAVAKHRAAKQARVRKRREEMRRKQDELQGLAPSPEKQDDAPPADAAPKQKKGSALPALRPDIKPDTPALRAERVEAIRRDLVRRRRRKGTGMLFKLWLFVIMPTIAVGAFLWYEASDLYKSESKFVVQSAEGAGAGGAGGLIGAMMGGGGSSLYDPIAVQTYILSRDVLTLLDTEHAWIAHFQDPDLDWWHRLPADATFEDAFEHYKSMVTVSYDPTEGILEMTLIASDPDDAKRFGQAIIGYAEDMVDRLSDRMRGDAVRDAEKYFTESRDELAKAQLEEAEARKLSEVFSVESEVAGQMSLIASLEGQRELEKSKLASLLRVTNANDSRVRRKQAAIDNLNQQIEDLRANIAGKGGGQTLADINAKMVTAQLNVQTALAIFTSALERLEMARTDAARQHRYLETVSSPSLPDAANYPKKPEMTVLAFLAFLGIYIIGSLTLSLIREQASI